MRPGMSQVQLPAPVMGPGLNAWMGTGVTQTL
jgi:hypothetical protein